MQKTFTCTEATITYDLEGSGPTVILLHGFGEDRRVWDEQVNYLMSTCHLIVPDLPGSGNSVINDHSIAGTMEFYASCINNLLNHENINKCIILGHSMGGYVTLCFAEKYTEKLAAFGLIHSTAFADSLEKKEIRRKGIDLIDKYGAYTFLKTTIPNLFSGNFKDNKREKIDALIEKGSNFSNKSLQQYYVAMMNRPDRTNVLKSTSMPVLFITGTEDEIVPMQDVLRQVYIPEKSYVHIFENTGHMGMWEAPEKMNAAIEEFIKEIN